MRDVFLISLAFTWHLPHQHLEEPERGGCPLGQKCSAEIYVFLNKILLSYGIIDVLAELLRTKCLPEMRDVLVKMRECGKLPKMQDFPHDCGTVDTYVITLGCVWFLKRPIYGTPAEYGLIVFTAGICLSETKPVQYFTIRPFKTNRVICV